MHYTTVAFQNLELKGLWTRLTGGDTSTDPDLDAAAERAVEKVWRNLRGMPKKGHTPSPHRGPELAMTRKHRAFNCECPKCQKGAA